MISSFILSDELSENRKGKWLKCPLWFPKTFPISIYWILQHVRHNEQDWVPTHPSSHLTYLMSQYFHSVSTASRWSPSVLRLCLFVDPSLLIYSCSSTFFLCSLPPPCLSLFLPSFLQHVLTSVYSYQDGHWEDSGDQEFLFSRGSQYKWRGISSQKLQYNVIKILLYI